MSKYNINAKVRVNLTNAGLRTVFEYWTEFAPPGKEPSVPGLNGIQYDTQLWELMNIFGEQLYHGTTVTLFENNEIEFLGE